MHSTHSLLFEHLHCIIRPRFHSHMLTCCVPRAPNNTQRNIKHSPTPSPSDFCALAHDGAASFDAHHATGSRIGVSRPRSRRD